MVFAVDAWQALQDVACSGRTRINGSVGKPIQGWFIFDFEFCGCAKYEHDPYERLRMSLQGADGKLVLQCEEHPGSRFRDFGGVQLHIAVLV